MKGDIQNWGDVGGQDRPIMVFGREKGEASLSSITEQYPFMETAKFRKVYKKDHHMISSLRQTPGSIGFADEKALKEQDVIAVLEIEGFGCSQAIPIAYDVSNEKARVVIELKSFIRSNVWNKTLLENGYIPPPDL